MQLSLESICTTSNLSRVILHVFVMIVSLMHRIIFTFIDKYHFTTLLAIPLHMTPFLFNFIFCFKLWNNRARRVLTFGPKNNVIQGWEGKRMDDYVDFWSWGRGVVKGWVYWLPCLWGGRCQEMSMLFGDGWVSNSIGDLNVTPISCPKMGQLCISKRILTTLI